MKKLQLDLDALRVESFETHGRASRGGTVRGYDSGISQLAGCTWRCPGTDAISCITCVGCNDSAVMSCQASDCTHEN